MTTASQALGSAEAIQLIERATVVQPDEPVFMARIRLRARRRVLWLRQLWTADSGGNLGLAISHGEVDRILLGAGELARAELAFHNSDPEARALSGPILAADAATADDEVVGRYRREFGMADAEVDLLTLAVAVEGDPWLGRVFGYVHDDANSCLATPWLAQQLFQWPPGAKVGPDAALVRWRMARPVEGQMSPWSVTAAWLADPHVASCLLRGLSVDPRLAADVELALGEMPAGGHCLYPTELAAMSSFVDALWRAGNAFVEISLVGPPGGGKRTLAAQVAAELEFPLLIADAGRLMGPVVDLSAATEAMIQVTRTARLFGAGVYWHDAELALPGAWHDAARRVPLTIFGGGSAPTATAEEPGVARRTIRLPGLTRAARTELWSRMSSVAVPSPVLEWALLPGDIARAAAVAPAGAEAVADTCGATARVESSELAVRLARPYQWDDLVVSAPVRRHLQELEAQARLRWTVYEDWDFGRLCPMGRGITALFAGPSGTGKTMSAQIIARSLGMDIYRIDLATVVNKYIGETEKNLGRVFDAAEHANVLLFFDEADALFGRRTQVKDAHDRFANIQIDYLLQRMEQFEGIAILATNRRGDLDSAFLRRLRFIVDFLPPSVAERRALWTMALPFCATNGDELLGPIDWDTLAQRLELTGADIKAAALAAAFLARDQGSRIEMTHVIHAVRRELAKRGVVVRSDDLGG